MLDPAQVQAFVAIVDKGGFARAAEALETTQPVISQQLKRLEQQVATRLIVRNRTRSHPTADGLRFLPHARGLLRAEARARAVLSDMTLGVAACSNIGAYHLPGILRELRERAQVDVEVKIGTNMQAAEDLVAGAADVAFMEWWSDRPGFEALVWRREPLVVIVAPDHRLAGRRSISKADALSEPMIGGEPGTGTASLLREAFAADVDDMKVSLRLGSTAAVKEAVKAGLGISIVMAGAIREEMATGSLVALAFDDAALAKPLYLAWPKATPQTATVATLAEIAEAAA